MSIVSGPAAMMGFSFHNFTSKSQKLNICCEEHQYIIVGHTIPRIIVSCCLTYNLVFWFIIALITGKSYGCTFLFLIGGLLYVYTTMKTTLCFVLSVLAFSNVENIEPSNESAPVLYPGNNGTVVTTISMILPKISSPPWQTSSTLLIKKETKETVGKISSRHSSRASTLAIINRSKSGSDYEGDIYSEDDELSRKKKIPPNLSGFVIGLNVILCTTSITLNGLIILFYRKSLKKIVPFLYFLNALIDLVISFGIALQSCALIPTITEETFVAGYLAVVSYVIVGVSVRSSTFVNLVLCVVRAINIVNPFYHVNKKLISFITLIYSLFWVSVSIYDMVRFVANINLTSGIYVIKSLVFKPEVGYAAIKKISHNSLSVGEDLLILLVPAFVVPVLLLIACTVVQVG